MEEFFSLAIGKKNRGAGGGGKRAFTRNSKRLASLLPKHGVRSVG